jgi:hypothetical protein
VQRSWKEIAKQWERGPWGCQFLLANRGIILQRFDNWWLWEEAEEFESMQRLKKRLGSFVFADQWARRATALLGAEEALIANIGEAEVLFVAWKGAEGLLGRELRDSQL